MPTVPVLEPAPSQRVARSLFPTEVFRIESRPHWIRPVKEILAGVAIGILAGRAGDVRIGGDPLPWVPAQWQIWVAVAVWSIWRVAHWWLFRFAVTTKRFVVVKGVLGYRAAALPLNQVTGMLYGHWLVGRLLNYGWIGFESVSLFHPLHRIRDMPDPNLLYLVASEELLEPAAAEARRYQPPDDEYLDFEPIPEPD